MGYRMKNQQGITLVEMLVALVLLSLVSILIFSIQLFGQKQFINQNEQIEHQETIQYAVKYIQKEIRKNGDISYGRTESELKIDNDYYWVDNSILYKNDVAIIEGIDELQLEINDSKPKKLQLTIISIPDSRQKQLTIKSEIYLRGGDRDE